MDSWNWGENAARKGVAKRTATKKKTRGGYGIPGRQGIANEETRLAEGAESRLDLTLLQPLLRFVAPSLAPLKFDAG